jgi:hypothetical protein
MCRRLINWCAIKTFQQWWLSLKEREKISRKGAKFTQRRKEENGLLCAFA